jgi:hypothetical protein
VLILDEDIVLDSATSRALGYEHVTVKAGQYPVDYSINPHGQVSPDVTTQGIVITIVTGLRSMGCTGFGICSITIDPFASTRAVPTAADWINGRLQLSFLAEPPDKTNVLTIEQDIVLDSATSRALGYEQVTVRAGQYPVDYGHNPYGGVISETTIETFAFGQNSEGALTLTWPGLGWTLQMADDVLGPWSDSPSQNSPVIVVPSGPKRWYRLVKP